ncbi:MAG: hypothetical protein WA051_01560 [Minisyncoccia bacterium]
MKLINPTLKKVYTLLVLTFFIGTLFAPFAIIKADTTQNTSGGSQTGQTGSTFPTGTTGLGTQVQGGGTLCTVIAKGIGNLGKTVQDNLKDFGSSALGGVGKKLGNWLSNTGVANTIGNISSSVGDWFKDTFKDIPGIGLIGDLASGFLGGGSGKLEVPVADSVARAQIGSMVQKDVGTGGTNLFPPCSQLSLNKIAIIAARALLKKITDETVNWINNGFEGKPAYAVQPGKFLQTSADSIAGSFINDLSGGFLCQPFRAVVQHSLIEDYKQHIPSSYLQQTQCTLSDVANFYKGDFSGGGWHSWFAMAQPQNNPTGAFLQTQEQLSLKLQGNKEITLAQLSWNRGFLSVADCVKYGPDTQVSDGFDPTTGDPHFKTVKGACIERGPIKTPGAVIETHLENVLGIEVRQLELVDDFNAIVGALYNYMNRRVFSTVDGLFSGGAEKDTPTFYYDGDTSGGIASGTGATSECSVSAENANPLVGDKVTWSVPNFTGGINTKFTWSSPDIGTKTTTESSMTVAYTTSGTKAMSISAEYDEEDLSNPTCTTGELTNCTYPTKHVGPVTLSCAQTIQVAKYKPLAASCVPDKYIANKDTAGNLGPSTGVTWSVYVTGGSGQLDRIWLRGDEDDVLADTNRDDGMGRHLGVFLNSNQQLVLPFDRTKPVLFGIDGDKNIYKFITVYTTLGTKKATAYIVDKDQTVVPITELSCTNSVLVQ